MYEYQSIVDFKLVRNRWVSYPPHFHLHCEFMYVLTGEVYVTVGGVTHTAREGDVIFIPPHQIHAFTRSPIVEVFTTFVSSIFLMEYLDRMNDQIPISPVIHFAKQEDAELCRHLFEVVEKKSSAKYCVNVNHDYPIDSSVLRSLVKSALLIVLENCEWTVRVETKSDLSGKVLDYCLEHYKGDISIAQLSAALGVSEHAVTRVFSESFRCSFRSYINSLRITNASEQLVKSSAPIMDIAYAVGYSTLRTFNRAFLAEKGMTPSEFRKQYGKMTEEKAAEEDAVESEK